ncbi:MAG TPA: FemAB family XrtA/PEP-CTERM system-associated protein [Gemmataceae bacterium]|nr:FemAB family XrtA/PEP-CTERM system-associated protein [Gemmataceae bacterium]
MSVLSKKTKLRPESAPEIRLHDAATLSGQLPRLEAYLLGQGPASLTRHPAWLTILRRGLGHVPYLLEASEEGRTCGVLPLALVRGPLFGRFLVGLPYVNSGGVTADNDRAAYELVERAAGLADDLRVRFLELRHEQPLDHPRLTGRMTSKVHMRLPLPATADALWRGLNGKARNQVRKARKQGVTVAWGGLDLLDAFYAVFSRNMRDLGTPVYGRGLFRAVLEEFPGRADLCVARLGPRPVAAALLLHGNGVSDVPSASSLRPYNHTCANTLLYWHLLERSVERGQQVFDFGRCTRGGSLFAFKAGWGAQPEPAVWQYYVRSGTVGDMRPDNPRYGRLIRLWQRLPVALTRLLGPAIVRGIP